MNIKKIGDYIIYLDKKLGEGGFSEVYLSEKNSQKFAVKIMLKHHDIEEEVIEDCVERQTAHLMKLVGKNIVYLHAHIETQQKHYLFLELCQSDLGKIIQQKPLPEITSIQFLGQILSGYQLLYVSGIIHRDLKPANILYKQGVLKISDFGISKTILLNSLNTSGMGTPLYMAPEASLQTYSYKVDIWSIGAIFYEMLHGKPPRNKRGEGWLRQDLSEMTKDLLTRCLKPDPQQRISFQQMMSHKVFDSHPIGLGYAQQVFKEVMKDVKPRPDVEKALKGLSSQNIQKQKLRKLLGQILQIKLDNTKFELVYQFLKNDRKEEVCVKNLEKALTSLCAWKDD